jgi:hypothetical protein
MTTWRATFQETHIRASFAGRATYKRATRGWRGRPPSRQGSIGNSLALCGRVARWLKVTQPHYREGARGWESK